MADSKRSDCSFCSEYGAQFYCFTCPTFYCEKCSIHNGDSKKLHQLQALSISCNKHTGIKSVIFCETCDLSVCQNCILKHTGGSHILIHIQDAIERKLRVIHHQDEELKAELKEVKRELEEISKETHVSWDEFFGTLEKGLIQTVRNSVSKMRHNVDAHLASRPIRKDQNERIKKELEFLLSLSEKLTCNGIIRDWESEWRTRCQREKFKPLETVDQYVHSMCSEKLGELKNGMNNVFEETYQKHFHGKTNKDNSSFKRTPPKEIKTGAGSLWDIACTSENSMICSAKNNPSLYEIQNERSKEIFLSTEVNPEYITTSPASNALLFTSIYQVFKISNIKSTDKTITEIFRKEYPLEFNGITFAAGGGVYLCMSDEKSNKGSVLKLDMDGNVKYKYFESRTGKTLFANPLYITENVANDGDICVSDNYSEVLSIRRQKEIRFVYKGQDNTRFDPRGLACEENGNVLIADFANNCIHVVDKNGKFLNMIGQGDIFKPTGLCIDRQRRIWITEYENGRVKMIDKKI